MLSRASQFIRETLSLIPLSSGEKQLALQRTAQMRKRKGVSVQAMLNRACSVGLKEKMLSRGWFESFKAHPKPVQLGLTVFVGTE